MKLGFNGRPFCQSQIRGLGRHTVELIKALHTLHPDWEFYIYSNGLVSPIYKNELSFAKFRDQIIRPKIFWDLFILPSQLKEDRVDLFHSTNNLGVPFFLWNKIPIFTTIHDHFTHVARMRSPKTLGGYWDHLNYLIEYFLLKRSSSFFSVSQDAKDNIQRYLSIPGNKITVAYNGVSLKQAQGEDSTDSSAYFLYVGGLEERKNIETLLTGFITFIKTYPGAHLKLVGKLASAPAPVTRLLKDHPDLFKVLEDVSDKKLITLYKDAQALILPSLQEGFGLPLIEAMKMGCPVVASDIKVFKEIGEGAVLYFSVLSPEDLCEKLVYLSNHPEVRTRLKSAGLEKCLSFTWTRMAETVAKDYAKFVRPGLKRSGNE